MAESIDCAHAKPSSAKRTHFQTKAYCEKWPFITVDERGDTCVNSELCSSVMKMIGLADSQVWLANSILCCVESVREVHNVGWPCDFPIKYGIRKCFINVGICLLMCFWKLCHVPDCGDFCSWKHNFRVGMYVIFIEVSCDLCDACIYRTFALATMPWHCSMGQKRPMWRQAALCPTPVTPTLVALEPAWTCGVTTSVSVLLVSHWLLLKLLMAWHWCGWVSWSSLLLSTWWINVFVSFITRFHCNSAC